VTTFRTDRGPLRAVDEVSFDVAEGATLGIVGESGSGKSVTALSILRLIAPPQGMIDRGTIEFRGKNLLQMTERQMQDVRGNEISMIFQEPMTSLNPVYTVGTQIVEAIRLHERQSRRAAREKAIEMLRLVGIASVETNIDAYPHQLSGGMRQRVMIAMALACNPSLLIADEPTTALDVTIQAQILELLATLKNKLGMSIVLITHDLGVVAEACTDVIVMYAGRIVESAKARALFDRPRHPYTRGLLRSLPSFDAIPLEPLERRPRLPVIEGLVPDLFTLPRGCRFQERCPMAIDACREQEPELLPVPMPAIAHGEVAQSAMHLSRCIRAKEV